MFTSYRRIIEKVDIRCAELAREQARHLVCHAGCDACCRQRLCLAPVEIWHIADWLAAQPDATKTRVLAHLDEADAHSNPDCPLLVEGRCLIYPVRPLVCRSHGFLLNLAQGKEADNLVRSCNLNFTTLSPDEIGASGSLNQPLLSALMFQVDGLFARAHGGYNQGERWELGRLRDVLDAI